MNFKSSIYTLVRFVTLIFLYCCLTDNQSVASPSRQAKNIVYIMLDDADYFDVGYNGALLKSPDAVTPNIDRLRFNGIAFTQFYSGSSICTPTRISILTGNNPIVHGAVNTWPQLDSIVQSSPGMSGLPKSIPQLGILMKKHGKTTAHHGKWHVGLSRQQYRHRSLGFDNFSYHRFGGSRSWSGSFEFISDHNRTKSDIDYIDTFFADQVIEFIEKSVKNGDDFYINYWPLTPHYPFSPPRNYDNSMTRFDLSENRGKVLAMMYSIDFEIGRITDALDRHDLLDDTLLIVTSDNGGLQTVQHTERFFKGSKGTLWEGGIRVPFIAHWPNGIAANSTNHSVMTTQDLLPTFLELIGMDPSYLYSQIQGRSKASAFFSQKELEHEPILWEINGSSTMTTDQRAQLTYALRDGNYKIIKVENRNDFDNVNAFFLYDILKDPQEKIDLKWLQPRLFQAMKRKLLSIRKSQSRFYSIPEFAASPTVIPFDPRLDVNTKSMTLTIDVIIPENLETQKNIYDKPGSQRVTLMKNRRIFWHLLGADQNNNPKFVVLKSPVLKPGVHQLILSISGFKKDFSDVELFVDGMKVTDLQSSNVSEPFVALWSTASDARLGDDGLEMNNIRYYTIKLWPDEL